MIINIYNIYNIYLYKTRYMVEDEVYNATNKLKETKINKDNFMT